jgi:hypothetical protein
MRPACVAAIVCFVVLGGVSACTTGPGPAPVVTLLLDGRACARDPDLAMTRALVLSTNKSVTVAVDEKMPCLTDSSGDPSLYAVFTLPQAMEEFLVSVTSYPQGQTLFAPRVMILDETGQPMREVSRDLFVFHGPALYLGLRVRAGERYLVVASDPKCVGQQVSHIQSATQSNTAAAVTTGGAIFVNINTGSETTSDYTYAHNGSITVAATPVPRAN